MNLNLLGFAHLCFRGPWLQALGDEGMLYFPGTSSEQLSGLFWCSCTLPSLGMALRLSEIPAKNNCRASAAEYRKPQEHEGRQRRPRNLLIKHCYGCEALPKEWPALPVISPLFLSLLQFPAPASTTPAARARRGAAESHAKLRGLVAPFGATACS